MNNSYKCLSFYEIAVLELKGKLETVSKTTFIPNTCPGSPQKQKQKPAGFWRVMLSV